MLNRKTQVYINNIPTMVDDDELTEGVKYYNSDMTPDTAKEEEVALAAKEEAEYQEWLATEKSKEDKASRAKHKKSKGD